MDRIYRVQCAAGRGPYRPGITEKWADMRYNGNCPTIFEDFGMDIVGCIEAYHRAGYHVGCAFKSPQHCALWFGKRERKKLKKLNYNLVAFYPDAVIKESAQQLFIGRRKPFKDDIEVLPWDSLHVFDAK